MMNVCLALLFTDVLALPSQAAQQQTSAEFQKLINGDEGVDATAELINGDEGVDATAEFQKLLDGDEGVDATPEIKPEVEVTEPAVEEVPEPDIEVAEPQVEVDPAPEEKVELEPEVDETIAVDPVDETIAVDPVEEVEPAPEASALRKEGISCGGHDEEVCGKCLEAAEEAKVDDKASYCNGDCQLTLGESAEDDVCSANGTAKFVDCGEHQAGDCAACANTARKHYCNGVCKWSDEENTCVIA